MATLCKYDVKNSIYEFKTISYWFSKIVSKLIWCKWIMNLLQERNSNDLSFRQQTKSSQIYDDSNYSRTAKYHRFVHTTTWTILYRVLSRPLSFRTWIWTSIKMVLLMPLKNLNYLNFFFYQIMKSAMHKLQSHVTYSLILIV